MTTKSEKSHTVNYLCCLILAYLSKIIQKIYLEGRELKTKIKKKNKKIVDCKTKLNESNIFNGLYDHLLFYIIDGTLTTNHIELFIKAYVKVIKNEKDRTFPRNSKTPFTKWYVKGYSVHSQLIKVLDAIVGNNVNTLNKNLKLIANSIKNISKTETYWK